MPGTFKDIVKDSGGNCIPFKQSSYVKGTTETEAFYHDVGDAEGINFNEGVCTGLTASYLIIDKAARSKKVLPPGKGLIEGFKEFLNTPDGRAMVSVIQLDESKAQDAVYAEVALTDFFSEGMGYVSLKHAETKLGPTLDAGSVAGFVEARKAYYTLGLQSKAGGGHMTGAIFSTSPETGKSMIVFFEPNFGFCQFNGPACTMDFRAFLIAYLASKYGNRYSNNAFALSRWE